MTTDERIAEWKQKLEDDGVFCYDDGVWLLAQLAARAQALDWQQCHAAQLEAQLAALTNRLEDTDAALVACERSRDQAKAALAERTRDCETLKEEILRQDARLRAVEQERDTLTAERADTQTRLVRLQEKLDAIAYWLNIGTAPTPPRRINGPDAEVL